ncbi:MAG: hypothetical protein DLM70_14435 [Chloroflexi bacterium]|nr:MAG: hypothetical protein DLM70_14435 [Chloroflexota bacterium]
MDIVSDFGVAAPFEDVWRILTNVPEVAQCVPGAEITEMIDDRHFKGTVKIKLGAIQVGYRGEVEIDVAESEHAIVLHAKGQEVRGSGGASATVTTKISNPETDVTRVDIVSDVDVSGRVAQFGRGIMQDVANRQVRQFAACLEEKLAPDRKRLPWWTSPTKTRGHPN